MEPLQTVLHYHGTTKHHPYRYDRSLGYLDWANQPDAFRRFNGVPELLLVLIPPAERPSYDDLYRPGAVPPRPECLETVSEFFQYSLALAIASALSPGSRFTIAPFHAAMNRRNRSCRYGNFQRNPGRWTSAIVD